MRRVPTKPTVFGEIFTGKEDLVCRFLRSLVRDAYFWISNCCNLQNDSPACHIEISLDCWGNSGFIDLSPKLGQHSHCRSEIDNSYHSLQSTPTSGSLPHVTFLVHKCSTRSVVGSASNTHRTPSFHCHICRAFCQKSTGRSFSVCIYMVDDRIIQQRLCKNRKNICNNIILPARICGPSHVTAAHRARYRTDTHDERSNSARLTWYASCIPQILPAVVGAPRCNFR